ncbi:NADH-quinone oxidoreductase subunit A [Halomonas korlensis]|uniref:NADH-quinone oxidoreductase subunit n=1 Tax=Halomonas korlensis TaxID=463301 RepID=A0A1I7H814_9GAMM|nr:NADH-quinone oxidoreductase subunit A [Halomonas korlensis]SFU56814.1 NADH dehydrogenase subunit A [Halomonas korlensis]
MELLTLLVILLLSLGAGLAVQWWPMRRQPLPSYPQRAPFLGGGLPDTHAWSRYHVRYYPMTLLLIAFEMEMMFMYPWAVVYVEKGMMAVMEMGMFLAILSVGIVYAWREGVFHWQ